MAVPTFGFSLGDFVAIVDVIQKVHKAFDEQNGASAEYRRLIHSISVLQLVFQELECLKASDTELSHINAIRAQARHSVQYLVAFRESIAKYDKYLGNTANSGRAKSSAKKVQWAVTAAGEVTKLNQSMAMEVEKLNLLLNLGQL